MVDKCVKQGCENERYSNFPLCKKHFDELDWKKPPLPEVNLEPALNSRVWQFEPISEEMTAAVLAILNQIFASSTTGEDLLSRIFENMNNLRPFRNFILYEALSSLARESNGLLAFGNNLLGELDEKQKSEEPTGDKAEGAKEEQ